MESATASAVLCELVGQVLFMRQQIPGLARELLDARQAAAQDELDLAAPGEARPRKPRSLALKRMLKTADALASLWSELHALLRQGAGSFVHRVVLLLGASMATPRETYDVELGPGCIEAAPGSGQAQLAVVRTVMRSLLVGSDALASGSLAPTKTFVLLHADRGCSFAQFSPRPDGYSLRQPAQKHVRIRLVRETDAVPLGLGAGTTTSAARELDREQDRQEPGAEDRLFYAFASPIAGLRAEVDGDQAQ